MVAKATTFTQYEGRKERRKEGKKEGRKERRKEGKKEGRKEGKYFPRNIYISMYN